MPLAPPRRQHAGPAPGPWPALIRLLLVLCAAWAASLAWAAEAPRFAAPAASAALRLAPEVLSAQERAFIAGLPELRVAIPQPAVQPYETVTADGVVSGIHADMLAYLARAFGLRVRPVLMPSFAASLQALRDREADVMMTLGYTAERARYLEFTLGVTPLPGALFARTGSTPVALEQARFAVERDFVAADYLRRQFPQARLVTVETTGDALRAVHEVRADYYLGALLTTTDWLSRQEGLAIEMRQLMNYSSGYYHFAVRKDWAPLARLLNQGISTLRASGQLRAATSAAMQAALASAPAGTPQAAPLALGSKELQTLVDKPVWRIGAVRGLPLLNHVEPDGQHTGIAAEVMEQVAQRIGVGVQVVPYATVGDLLDGLRAGQIDLVPFLTRTPQREAEFAFSRPYVEMPYVIVARSDAPLYFDLHSLRGRRLALPAQHPLRPLLAERHPDIELLTVPDGNRAMDAVADGRADAAVEVKLFANLRIQGEGEDRLRTVAHVEELPAQFHFAGLPGAQPLLALVDRALLDIPEADSLRMRRRWVAVDLAPSFPWRRHLPVLAVSALGLLLIAGGTLWWLRRLAREVKQRRRSEARLQDIGAALPCVAFREIYDAQGRLKGRWLSPGAAEMLALAPTPAQSVLAALALHLPLEQRAELQRKEHQALETRQRLQATVAYAHPDGQTRWLNCEAVCTAAEDPALALTGILVDVSAEHELQARLVDAARQRNLLLASASHELRAPAHTLSLALQALQGQALPVPAQGTLRIARDAVETLSQLLGDVLDAARLDGQPLRLQARPLDLPELLRGVAEGARITARAKDLHFKCRFAPELPGWILHDPLRLKQILMNLLSNAFKYTAAGEVGLSATVAATGGEPELCLQVWDTGSGIAPEAHARLFTPFVSAQAPRHARPPEGSTGLGLAICRELATLMGGRIELSSQPGKGTQALLCLPLRACEPPPADPGREGVVLVCDDDITSRYLLGQLLRSDGHAVEEASDAQTVLARCALGGVAAVVTDLHMPGLDGLALLHALRQQGRPGPGQQPLLVLCSGDVPQSEGEGMPPADARLVKPVDVQALRQVLRQGGVRPHQPSATT